MTNEEAIKKIKDILEEVTETDDSVCYVTSDDTDALKAAIKALEIQPCEDCISRTDALNAFKPKGISEELWMESNTYKVLTKLSSVTPKTEWISVGERLPNEFADVLCNTDSEEIFIATYLGKMNDGINCFDDNNGMMWEGNIIAWMPLPEPYKAESEEENE